MHEFLTISSAEIMRRLHSRIFLLGLLLGAVGIAVLLKLPAYMTSFAIQSNSYVLAGDPLLDARAKPLLSQDFAIVGTIRGRFDAKTVSAHFPPTVAGIIDLKQLNGRMFMTIYAKDPANLSTGMLQHDLLPLSISLQTRLPAKQIAAMLVIPITIKTVNSKFATASEATDVHVVGYLLIFLLYLLIMVNSQLIMTSVAEEKTSRIAEMLLASVDPSILLAAKITASAILAIIQMAVWVAIGFALGSHVNPSSAHVAGGAAASALASSSFSLSSVSRMDLAAFMIFFIIGYLQMSTLFAAAGALVNRTEDIGALAGPLALPAGAALIVSVTALVVPDIPPIVAASFLPVFAPFVMFARIVVSDVPVWQIVVSLIINGLTTIAIAVIGGKIYRLGMLLYGRPPKFGQILHALNS